MSEMHLSPGGFEKSVPRNWIPVGEMGANANQDNLTRH